MYPANRRAKRRHGSPDCVMSEVADQPCVSDRSLFECYTMRDALIVGLPKPYAKLKKAVRHSTLYGDENEAKQLLRQCLA